MILVTGGTGFLGRHLIPALCQRGDRVKVFSRQPERAAWLKRYPSLDLVQGDLQDAAAVRRAADGCRYIIHAGGLFRFWGPSEAFEQTNVQGAEHVMRAALDVGAERMIHVSTAAVIGQPDPDAVLDETTPVRPVDPYQRSKWRAEQIAQRYFQEQGLPVVVLRPGAYYGPLGRYAFNRLFFRDPLRGIIMQVDGGRYIIFPAYISDVVQGVLLALEKGVPGEVYNICGDWISHREAFDIICQEANLHWPRLQIPGWVGIFAARVLEGLAVITRKEPFWPINLRSYVYNNWRVSSDKARRELGFKPTTFREGARRTLAWYRAGQPDHLPELEC